MYLRDYARIRGIGYRAAWNRHKAGTIPGSYKDDSGHIIVPESAFADVELEKDSPSRDPLAACVYARVSDPTDGGQLEAQAVRVSNWCSARGYQIVRVAKEKASGLNGSRRGLTSVLKDPSWSVLVVDTKEVLAPHESDHIILLLEQLDRRVDIVNIAGSEEVFYE
jgi:predicted site-specific integrase-resolvase